MPASFAAAARARSVVAKGTAAGGVQSADFVGQRRTGSGAGGGRLVATAHCDAVLTSELQYEASRAAEMALPFRAHQPFKGRAAAVGQGSSPKQAGGSVGAGESVADV